MITIRPMTKTDEADVLEMMRVFYASPAVLSNGSDAIFRRDIEACVGENPFAEGYILQQDGCTAGYGMLAKSFSTEFGKNCIWVEDLYVKDDFRGLGLGSRFMTYVSEAYPDHVIRLEVEEENQRAVHVYEKSGFAVIPYMEMIRHGK